MLVVGDTFISRVIFTFDLTQVFRLLAAQEETTALKDGKGTNSDLVEEVKLYEAQAIGLYC